MCSGGIPKTGHIKCVGLESSQLVNIMNTNDQRILHDITLIKDVSGSFGPRAEAARAKSAGNIYEQSIDENSPAVNSATYLTYNEREKEVMDPR